MRNAALALDRRIAVNLNYTVSADVLNDCVADNGSSCNFGEDCPMRPVWCDAQAEGSE